MVPLVVGCLLQSLERLPESSSSSICSALVASSKESDRELERVLEPDPNEVVADTASAEREVVLVSRSFQGPLPPPEVLDYYERIHPGSCTVDSRPR